MVLQVAQPPPCGSCLSFQVIAGLLPEHGFGIDRDGHVVFSLMPVVCDPPLLTQRRVFCFCALDLISERFRQLP